MTTILDTERLIVRDWLETDLDAFHAICSDASVMRFVSDGQVWSLQRTRAFIERAIASSAEWGYCQWPLIQKDDGSVIGFCGFVNAVEGAEIGWRLARGAWGRGLATEAAEAVLKHGFDSLKLSRVVATVQTSNVASLHIAEKLGMIRKGNFRRDGRELVTLAASHS
jgi:RimJ/RimL family protein N-acetyltransferase